MSDSRFADSASLVTALFAEHDYLRNYPDVAKVKIDPLNHYLQHGRFEERWPAAFQSVAVRDKLWQSESARQQLIELIEHKKTSNELQDEAEVQLAKWFLAQYYGSVNDWSAVLRWLAGLEQTDGLSLLRALVPHAGPFLCLFQGLYHTQQYQRARALLAAPHWPSDNLQDRHNHSLAQSMVATSAEQKLSLINGIYQTAELGILTQPAATLTFDRLTAAGNRSNPRFWQRAPKVSVIVPCYNCAATLATAVTGLQRQSWQRLQIILVNDASTDNTAEVMAALASHDKRITQVHLSSNEGPYGARNAGLDVAKGSLVTTHDADDWSHPDKIACQVTDLLKHPKAIANRSAWVRADNDLNFSRWRPEASWIYPNVSSLMFRRRVFKRLGYWDTVTADGDTEFYYRLLAEFGEQSVREVLPTVPLAFGRVQATSLTQTQATHVSSMLGGVRSAYQTAAADWHQSTASRYLSRYPKQRPFIAPLSLCRGSQAAQQDNALKRLQQSQLFDATYYLSRYPDVAVAGMDAALHYLKFGAAEGRDPSAYFSSSGYAFVHGLSSDQNPLLHYLAALESGQQPEQAPELTLSADSCQPHKPTLMVVAHSSSGHAFGAEKSLLDVLRMLQDDYNLWVILPSALNHDYIKQIQQLSDRQSFLPIRWWRPDRAQDEPVVAQLVAWLTAADTTSPQQLYVNTLTLHEPLVAAQQANRPCSVHVRELPAHDPDLCDALAATADSICDHVLTYADCIIANSAVVATAMNAPSRTTIVPNVVDSDAFSLAQTALPNGTDEQPLKVAMLSSNLAKKGVKDFYQLAGALYNDTRFEWHLFGPHTPDLNDAQHAYPQAKVTLHGYTDTPVQALKQSDVIVNLSHFQESFGRSVLEALAAGKVVIAYDWGALTELLSDGAGLLVPYQDHNALRAAVVGLAENLAQALSLRDQGLRRAQQFDLSVVKPQLLDALAAINERDNES